MSNIIKNPMTIWIKKFVTSQWLMLKYKKYHLRIGYLSYCHNTEFGNYNTLYNNVIVNKSKLGDYTYVSNGTKIYRAKIGKFCCIGPDCKVGLGTHPSKNFVSSHPAFYSLQKQSQITFADRNYFEEFNIINIGNDVWIGANVVIVDGVTIGDGVIVGAGAVVTKDVEPYSIIGGVPAKLIRKRFTDEEIASLIKFKWWDKDIKWLKKNYKEFHSINVFKETYLV